MRTRVTVSIFFFLRKPQVFLLMWWCWYCLMFFNFYHHHYHLSSLVWGIITGTTCLPHEDVVRVMCLCLQIWRWKTLMCERRDSCVIKPWSRNIAELSLHCSISLWTNSSPSLACVCFQVWVVNYDLWDLNVAHGSIGFKAGTWLPRECWAVGNDINSIFNCLNRT